MGVPQPHFMAWLTILTELLGGFAVILGAFVAIVSLPMAIVLLVAIFEVHRPYGRSGQILGQHKPIEGGVFEYIQRVDAANPSHLPRLTERRLARSVRLALRHRVA
jgi:uncharacterized membrane protein YphA (DoxX/SURF4 family)